MDHCGYVFKVEKIRKHGNADRLQIVTVYEQDVIVGLDLHKGDMCVFFPCDLQLSEEFCQINDLVRRKNEDGTYSGGYMDPDKRAVKAIKLRGEKSEGLVLPISCLADFCKISDLKVGDHIDVLDGREVCRKYIPRTNPGRAGKVPHIKAAKKNYCPLFSQHVDTEQLVYNLDKFHNGDTIQLTLKMHGTSSRHGNLPIIHEKKQNWLQKLLRRPVQEYTEYGYVLGTRRVVIAEGRKGGFYESDDFRHAMHKKVEGKLHKGETLFGEIVGFQGPNGAPIMGQVANSKVKDKEFSRQYGDITTFSYDCEQDSTYEEPEHDTGAWKPCCELYVYRMTLTNEDGYTVEYSPDQIRLRCEQMGLKVVPEFERFIIPEDVNPGEYVLRKVEQYYDGPDPIGRTHVREGVVVRICNRSNFAVYKHKNFNFKLLSGIAIEQLENSRITDDLDEDLLLEM